VVALVTVDVARLRLPAWKAITAVADLRERALNVVIQLSVLLQIELVTIGMRVCAGGVT